MTTERIPATWLPNAPVKRVHVHWTAGTHTANKLDRVHYHFLREGSGKLVRGTHSLTKKPPVAHTLNANTGAAGVSLCCMGGAKESDPVNSTRYPMTRAQWDGMIQDVAQICSRYGIVPGPKTVLTHAEIESNLGIKQRGKWDITFRSFDPSRRGAKVIGDILRAEVVRAMTKGDPIDPRGAYAEAVARVEKVLKERNARLVTTGVTSGNGSAPGEPAWSKEDMEEMQQRLHDLGYAPGGIDGKYGTLTAGAVARMHAVNGTTGPADSIPRTVGHFIMSDGVKPMQVSAERATATASEIAGKVPEASATRWAFFTNAGEKIIYVAGAAFGYFTDTVTKVTDTLPEPIRDAVREVPPGAILAGVVVIAAASLFMALRAGRTVESAYQQGRLS